MVQGRLGVIIFIYVTGYVCALECWRSFDGAIIEQAGVAFQSLRLDDSHVFCIPVLSNSFSTDRDTTRILPGCKDDQ